MSRCDKYWVSEKGGYQGQASNEMKCLVEAKSNNGTQKWKYESVRWVVGVPEKQLLNYDVEEAVEGATTDK